jgi:hypothetical protein
MVKIIQRTKLPLKAQPQVADVLNYSVFLLGGVQASSNPKINYVALNFYLTIRL